MGPIDSVSIQQILDKHANREMYLHLETTNGAYAAHRQEHAMAVCAYIRNGKIQYSRGVITGNGPYRVGLQMDIGWVYAEGLTDWEVDSQGRLLMAGHDNEGRIAIACELSTTPFDI